MSGGRVHETLRLLAAAREQSDVAAVAYSGGKDSLVVADLCMRAFEGRCSFFYMYLVPGLALPQKPALPPNSKSCPKKEDAKSGECQLATVSRSAATCCRSHHAYPVACRELDGSRCRQPCQGAADGEDK